MLDNVRRRSGTRWILPALAGSILIAGAMEAVRREAWAGDPQGVPLAAHVPRWTEIAHLQAGRSGDGGTLGLVADAVLARGERVFVLDAWNKRVLAFGVDGRFLGSLGRPGNGPGEFVAPLALAADRTGRVYVLDPGNRRIEAYAASTGLPARTGSLPLDFEADDICTIGDQLFVLGGRNGYLLHEYSAAQGKIVRSFAPDAEATDALMSGYRSTGYLECSPQGDITFLPLIRPEVERYSARSGTLTGKITLPGYVAAVVKRLPDGALLYQEPHGRRSEAASSIISLPDGRQIVQVGVLRPGGGSRFEFRSLRSIVISWDDRSAREVRETLPRLIWTEGRRALSAETDPEPRVRVLAVDAREGES